MSDWIVTIDGIERSCGSQARAFEIGTPAGLEGKAVSVKGMGSTWRYVGMGKGDHPSGQLARAKDRGAWRMEKAR